VIARVGSLRTVVAEQAVPAGPLILALTISDPPPPHGPCTGPDIASLGIGQPDGAFTELAALDGRYLSTEVAGGFTGRVIGMYAAAGTVHFDWFDYEPLEG
jgi:hypothetical protein